MESYFNIKDLNSPPSKFYPSKDFLNCFIKKSSSQKLPLKYSSPLDYSERKLIGQKYPLDSEFLSGPSKMCSFNKSKKGLLFKSNDNPAPNAYKISSADQLTKKSHPKVIFNKEKKKYFGDEVPRTETPGPIYTYKKSVLSK